MTASQNLKLYELLGKHFGNSQDAREVVTEIELIIENRIEDKKSILLTKDDKIDLIDRINKSKLETILWIVGTGVLQFILSLLAKKFM